MTCKGLVTIYTLAFDHIVTCSVEVPEPDIAHRDLARLTFDLEADQSRLIVGGVFVVIDEDRHQLTVHDVHHHAAARNDLVVIPLVDHHVSTERLFVAYVRDEAVGLAGKRLRDLAAICEDALHRVFGVPLTCIACGLRTDWKPKVCLRAGHHKSEVIRGLPGWLGTRPRYAGDATVLNATATAVLDFHLQLEIEVARLVTAIHDVVVALRV